MKRTSSIHIARAGETPRGLARRFQLHSWVAIVLAPENMDLRDATADQALTAGTTLRIPPQARGLLIERIYVLQRVRPLLLRHYEMLEELFVQRLIPVVVPRDLGDGRVVEHLLRPLALRVAEDVRDAHRACEAFVPLNNALALTHLHSQADLSRYAGGTPGYAGLNWLLTPEKLELWYTMWAHGSWAVRWRGFSHADAMHSAGVHLNFVRSKVIQQIDERIRQTQLAVRELGNF